jgi:hypothetical protein
MDNHSFANLSTYTFLSAISNEVKNPILASFYNEELLSFNILHSLFNILHSLFPLSTVCLTPTSFEVGTKLK